MAYQDRTNARNNKRPGGDGEGRVSPQSDSAKSSDKMPMLPQKMPARMMSAGPKTDVFCFPNFMPQKYKIPQPEAIARVADFRLQMKIIVQDGRVGAMRQPCIAKR